jgi:hypothetical protein
MHEPGIAQLCPQIRRHRGLQGFKVGLNFCGRGRADDDARHGGMRQWELQRRNMERYSVTRADRLICLTRSRTSSGAGA